MVVLTPQALSSSSANIASLVVQTRARRETHATSRTAGTAQRFELIIYMYSRDSILHIARMHFHRLLILQRVGRRRRRCRRLRRRCRRLGAPWQTCIHTSPGEKERVHGICIHVHSDYYYMYYVRIHGYCVFAATVASACLYGSLSIQLIMCQRTGLTIS